MPVEGHGWVRRRAQCALFPGERTGTVKIRWLAAAKLIKARRDTAAAFASAAGRRRYSTASAVMRTLPTTETNAAEALKWISRLTSADAEGARASRQV
jgi:hypothetical protein